MLRHLALKYLYDLRCEDSRKRKEALQHVDLIAQTFELQRTESEFLPFLREFEDDDEDVLLGLCEALDALEKFITRRRGDVSELIPHFSTVLSYEDFSVADLAMAKLEQVARGTRYSKLFDLAASLLTHHKRMSTISAIRIFCRLIGNIPERHYESVLVHLKDAVRSPDVVVRRELAKEIRALIVEGSQNEPEAIAILQQLTADPQDSVVFNAAQSWCSLTVSKHCFTSTVLPVLETLVDSPSWRVRYVIACGFPNIISKIFPGEYSDKMMSLVARYLSDPEIEVSIKTVEILRDLTQFIDQKEVDQLIPGLEALTADATPDTRLAIAKSLPSLAYVGLGRQTKAYMQMIGRLLQDSPPDIPMVLLCNFEPIWNNFDKTELIKMINPILIRLLNDGSWTIRYEAILSVEKISQKFGERFAADPEVISTFKEKLSDRVFQIRDNTVTLLGSLARFFGPDYAERQIFPIFLDFQTHRNYLYRLNYLKGMAVLAKLISLKAIHKEVPVIQRLCYDRVPNVRQQAVATLNELYQSRADPVVERAISSVAKDLAADSDNEVRAEIAAFRKVLDDDQISENLDNVKLNHPPL